MTRDHLLLSFAAGMSISSMQHLLPPETRIARLMTNTPVQYCEGVSSYSMGKDIILLLPSYKYSHKFAEAKLGENKTENKAQLALFSVFWCSW